jgi:hypothetical protein
MRASIFRRKIDINWWLLVFITILIGVYRLFLPYDHENWNISDWGYLTDWVRHYHLDPEFWGEVGFAIFLSFGPAFVIGFFTQFLIMFIWQLYRRPNQKT